MIEILRMINKEKNLIDQELALPYDERILYYKNFLKKYKADTLTGALNTPKSELAIVILLEQIPELSIEAAKELVYANKGFFDRDEIEGMGQLEELVRKFSNDPKIYKKIRKMIISQDDYKLTSLLSEEGRLSIILRHLIDEANIEPSAFFSLVEFYNKNTDDFEKTLAILSILRDIETEQAFHGMMLQALGSGYGVKVKQKDLDKEVRRIIGNDYHIDRLLEPLTNVSKASAQYDLQRTDRHKELNRNKAAYETLETELYKAIQNGEITNIKNLLKRVPSEAIRLEVLKLVYKHNQEIYNELANEYQILSANDASHYQMLLAKYGISPDCYEVGTVMENSIDDLERMLEIISKLQITAPSQLLSIIQNSNLETIENIHGLAERGIITANLLIDHQNLFNPSSEEYENFMRNLNLISKKKLNPHYFTASEEVLMLPAQVFTTNLSVLEDYSLLPNIKTGMNLSFLNGEDIATGIDTLLELGYEKNLEECLELLNYKNKFDRLKVLKELNIPVTDTQALIEVLTTDKFYIPDSEIPNYIYNAAAYHMPKNIVEVEEPKKKVADVTRLSAFSNTERTYSFNGVLISKNKVHRNLSHVLATGNPTERIIYGVLKDATLSEQEVLKVVAAITPQKTANAVKTKK